MAGQDDTSEYEVGYGKPPKHSQFKRGTSGNPRGRPRKRSKDFGALLQEALSRMVALKTAGKVRHVCMADAIAESTLQKALQGSLRACKIVMKWTHLTQSLKADRKPRGLLVVPEIPATVEEWEAQYGPDSAYGQEMLRRQAEWMTEDKYLHPNESARQ